MNKALFVTGTDTGVGKTYVACLLIKHFARRGVRVAGFKPVAAGATLVAGELQNEDALALWQSSNVPLTYHQVNPVCLPVPVSPHLAAEDQGVVIDRSYLLRCADDLKKCSDLLVVEGAGGWRVPLAPGVDVSDLAKALVCPVVLVVGLRLGCINHARLSLEVLRADGVEVCGWIASEVEPGLLFGEQVLSTLTNLLDTPLLAKVNFSATSLCWTAVGEKWQENLQIVFDS